jgi:putative transposase
MRRPRQSLDRIRSILTELEDGAPVSEVGARHGVSSATVYRWLGRYAHLSEIAEEELPRLESLERQVAALRQQLEEAREDLELLRRLVRLKGATVARGRALVATCVDRLQVSERQACRALGVQRSSIRYGNRAAPPSSAASSERDATPRRR